MRLTVVANPGSRRAVLFAAAAARAGLPEPEIVAWHDVAAGAALRLTPHSLVRLESPGEDPEVDRLLRGAAVPLEHGELAGGRSWYAGFRRAVERVADAAREQGAYLWGDPAEVAVMFDKAACHARLSAAGIPVPPALPESPVDWADLRTRLTDAGWRRVFVKPRHGSSAAGVIALEFGPAGRLSATTSVEPAGGKLFNSLRVRRHRDEQTVAAIVDRLAPDGLHVERWFPKAGLGGRVIDLRVVVIGGEPSHVVVRGSTSPMTNLHLGGVRGDLAEVRAAAGPEYAAALDTCRRVADAFPGSPHVGVDLMLGSGWRSHAVAEVNAFGDLLPNLLVDGRDTYDAELASLAASRWVTA
ncbi:STM4014 family protein [Hamadaea tsunoensis]|uniref:STM4014 family protein n=1 Tax=Hamadaea tsunoensis TaxID=53368 RepID=UPI0004246A29|nr:STM4014 family protein [Hamadaea tsunoensis]